MEEKNPLHIHSLSPIISNNVGNKRGRPTAEKIIKFSQQPKSIIAQMLSEMKTKEKIDHSDKSFSSVDKDEPANSHNKCELDINLDDQSHYIEVDIPEDYVCEFCTYRSSTIEELRGHQADLHKQFYCDYPDCNYSCKLSSNLIKHKRGHTNEKPYLCDKCSFRSNYVNSLKTHKRTHTMERPHQCQYCNYKCNSSSNLKKHCRHRHSDAIK